MVSDREPPWVAGIRQRVFQRAGADDVRVQPEEPHSPLPRGKHVGSAHCNRLEVGNLRFTNVGGLGPGLVSGIG